MFLGYDGLFLSRLLVAHAAFEFLDAVTDAPGETRQLLRSEEKNDYGEDRNQFHWAEAEHGKDRIHTFNTVAN